MAHVADGGGQCRWWQTRVAIFVFSFAFGNSSFYDAYWSVAPPVIVAYLALVPAALAGDRARLLLVFMLVALWAVRLTWNWARGWTGLGHEDWRYVDFRQKSGRAYWAVSFVRSRSRCCSSSRACR